MAIKFTTSSSTLTNPTYKAYVIEKFNGVDYTTTPTSVSDTRALDISNYMPSGNALVKRNGFQKVYDADDWKIYSLAKFKDKYIVMVYKNNEDGSYTTSLYETYDLQKVLEGNLLCENNIQNELYFWTQEYNQMLFILYAEQYLMYDGCTLKPVSENAYVPTVAIGVGHTLSSDKMVALEEYNLLSNSCYITLNQYLPDLDSETYNFDLSFIGKKIESFELIANNINPSDNYKLNADTKILTVVSNKVNFQKIEYPFNLSLLKKVVKTANVNLKNIDDYRGVSNTNIISNTSGNLAKTIDVIEALKKIEHYERNEYTSAMNDTYTEITNKLLESGVEIGQKYSLSAQLKVDFNLIESQLFSFNVLYYKTYYPTIGTNYTFQTFQNAENGYFITTDYLKTLLTNYLDTDKGMILKTNGYVNVVSVLEKFPSLTISSDKNYRYNLVEKTVFVSSNSSYLGATTMYGGFYNEKTITWSEFEYSNYSVKYASIQDKYLSHDLPQAVCKITYSSNDYKTIEKNRFGISFGSYGYRDRLFLAGNDNNPNTDWHSCHCSYPLTIKEYEASRRNEWDDYTYFGDMSFQTFGSSNTEITGYGMLTNGTMAIFKKSENNQPNLYFRTYNIQQNSEGNYVETFPITLSGLSIGSDYPNQIIQYDNKIMVNASNGIYMVDLSTSTASQAYSVKELSYMIRNELSNDILDSSHVVYDGKLFLSRKNKNGLKRMYVADKDRYTYVNDKLQYEWWVLDGVNADKMYVIDDELYFTNENGLYKFNKEQMYDEFIYMFNSVNINNRTINSEVTIDEDIICLNKQAKMFVDGNISGDYEKNFNFIKENTKFSFDKMNFKISANSSINNDHWTVLCDDEKHAQLILSLFNNRYDLKIAKKNSAISNKRLHSITKIECDYNASDNLLLNIYGTTIEESKGVSIFDLGVRELEIRINTDDFIYSISEMYTMYEDEKYPLSQCNVIDNVWYCHNDTDFIALGNVNDVVFNYIELNYEKIKLPIWKGTNNSVSFTNVKAQYHRPIISYWYSNYNDLGTPLYLKTTYSITFVPDANKGGFTQVGYQTSKTKAMYNTEMTKGLFAFDQIEFDDFVFGYDNFAHSYSSKKKIKNFAFLQFILYSDKICNSTIVNLALRYRLVKSNKGVK